MIRAGSLIYAVIIALLLAIMSASVILLQYFKIIEAKSDMQETVLRQNAISAINLTLRSGDFIAPSLKTISLYDGFTDSVSVEIEKWGVLNIIKATALSGNKSFTQSVLVGDLIDQTISPALYLADYSSPLSVCGKTLIRGNCFLPKSGVKRAYIEGQNFIGSKLIDGRVETSGSALPLCDKKFVEQLKEVQNYHVSNKDSIVGIQTPSGYFNFKSKTAVLSSAEEISLTGNNYEGRMIVVSKKAIRVSRDTKLKDVIIIAPIVSIEDHFEGDIQIFASDSVYIGKNVNLKYPSVVCTIASQSDDSHSHIIVDDGASIAGLIMINNGYDPIRKATNLMLGAGTLVTGQVYCNGILQMKGNIIGSLYCTKIILRTPSAIYEDHLLNATIDMSRIPKGFALKNFLDSKTVKTIIKWL